MVNKMLYRITVTGDVQGVGFRWRTMHEAHARGICGFVENRPDGSVYIEADGYREVLDDFVLWCKDGPGYVENVRYDVKESAGYTDFTIRH